MISTVYPSARNSTDFHSIICLSPASLICIIKPRLLICINAFTSYQPELASHLHIMKVRGGDLQISRQGHPRSPRSSSIIIRFASFAHLHIRGPSRVDGLRGFTCLWTISSIGKCDSNCYLPLTPPVMTKEVGVGGQTTTAATSTPSSGQFGNSAHSEEEGLDWGVEHVIAVTWRGSWTN